MLHNIQEHMLTVRTIGRLVCFGGVPPGVRRFVILSALFPAFCLLGKRIASFDEPSLEFECISRLQE